MRLSRQSTHALTLTFGTIDGTAQAGSDYTARRGRIVFRRGIRQRTVTVLVRADDRDEARETFGLLIAASKDARRAARFRVRDNAGVAAIRDQDAAPAISVFGDSGRENLDEARFKIALSRETYRAVDVSFSTQPGTAGPQDFIARSGRVRIPAGQRSVMVGVRFSNDGFDEPDETFSLVLRAPTGGRLKRASATATIVDDDVPRAVSVGDTAVWEGSSGTKFARVTLTARSVPGTAVTVRFATVPGTAADGADYTSTSGTLTLGHSELRKYIDVPLTPDTLDEDDETFVVRLSDPQGGTIGDAEATVTIRDDDSSPLVGVADVIGGEGDQGIALAPVLVTLSKASGRTATVKYRMVDDTATVADGDYDPVSGTVTFLPGETSKEVLVPIHGDLVVEPDEQLRLEVFDAVNAVAVSGLAAFVVIQNDDA